ncbi:MAG: class II glutamine amidotransferase, partial [Candidatus Omnitrophica bacterium]|nr:class II glutamine amidotransferase [Candidatus Omnitrophota bacterium]
MCGIIGYIGERQAQEVLLKGLKGLQYRGYDSCGIAVYYPQGNSILVKKLPGKIKDLEELLKRESVEGNLGISHTRWATHGTPNYVNAHPHLDCELSLIHI